MSLHDEAHQTEVIQKLTTDQRTRFEDQWSVLTSGVADLVPIDGFRQKLSRSIATQTPLRIKLGLDPTAPDLHLGHTVVLHKLRQFQQYGHHIQLIIGDFTGRIGDPTGKSATRKPLTEADVMRNAETYRGQLSRILDMERVDMVYNATWLQPLTFAEVVSLAAKMTVARMMERDDFQKRYADGQPIALHEFFYPIMQGYDSVHLRTDVELGGTDQKFNLLMGRTLQKEFGQEPQVTLMMPLLEGTDGVHKMSKSLNNAIGIADSPQDMYGKVMSIPDSHLANMMRLASGMPSNTIDDTLSALAQGTMHPRDVKMLLARTITAQYHGGHEATEAEQQFIQVFQQRSMPQQIEEVDLATVALDQQGAISMAKLLVVAQLLPSMAEAKRVIQGGGCRLNGTRIIDAHELYRIQTGDIVQVGKRTYRRIVLVSF